MSDSTMEHLLKDCLSGDPSRQTPAIMKLQDLEAYEAVPILIESLASPERNVRGCAIEALGWLG
jgi:HEAT repeat protein